MEAQSEHGHTEDSSRSALTFMPPVTREMVSLPDKSVTWTKVSLNLVDQCWTLGSTFFPSVISTVWFPAHRLTVIPTMWFPAHRLPTGIPRIDLAPSSPTQPLDPDHCPNLVIRLESRCKLTRQRCEQRQRRAHPRQRWGRERQLPAEGHELSWEPGTVSTCYGSSLSDIPAIRPSLAQTLPKCPSLRQCTARPKTSAPVPKLLRLSNSRQTRPITTAFPSPTVR